MTPVGGIHHVTAIAGHPQENVDFYAGVLGMRLVKRSVNQDEPGTYHLFFADAEGHPGTDLTFFASPDSAPGRSGAGMVNEVALAVPPRSVASWRDRLDAHGTKATDDRWFGEDVLRFRDPHGLHVALVGSPLALERPFAAWARTDVPAEHQVRGLHAARIVERDLAPTLHFATRALGLERVGADGAWERFRGRDAWSGFLDVRADPDARPGQWGAGTVHHVAWRARDGEEQLALQRRTQDHGVPTTPVIDRFYFRSIYFREPGGTLFEIATDGPGFDVDEPVDELGEHLALPPWLAPMRKRIEENLVPITLPHQRASANATRM